MRLPTLPLISLLVVVFTSSFVNRYEAPDTFAKCDLEVTYKVTPTSLGKSTGEIEVTVRKGDGPYQIHWIGLGEKFGEGTKVKNLKEGFYTVHVVDANKCIKVIPNIKVESK